MTTNTPQAVLNARQAVRDAAEQVRAAKATLEDAQHAHAGAADADADAYLAAVEAGKSAPAKLPSVALTAARDTAQSRLAALTTIHGRAVERLAESYRTEAGAWHAATLEVADAAEAECLAALAVMVETFDRSGGAGPGGVGHLDPQRYT